MLSGCRMGTLLRHKPGGLWGTEQLRTGMLMMRRAHFCELCDCSQQTKLFYTPPPNPSLLLSNSPPRCPPALPALCRSDVAALCSAPAMLFLNSVLGRDDLQTRALPLGRVLFFPLVFFSPPPSHPLLSENICFQMLFLSLINAAKGLEFIYLQ